MQQGVVKWFDPVKGYGFIAGENGKDVFVHQSNVLMNGFRFLEAGQKVSYWVEPTEKGNKAVNVVIVK
ncbi:cold shock domain-containing protein [Frisingicoccus caecimuris]|uniref:Putative cold-shock DNA-binding protein n=1 Tax=Frisingicoccus caecimuris TaxID=1796636 RepID=A0A4R2LD45_9FIRM|nr:cold shock domain-containing protein [Frisingicoccus caecimuris]MCR1917521.1 cold shock domain-containing protein [Frisingicoccus caecimuris]TCO85790.1 putative cold-shock DNA-binding protein [Frisingicoccus caecimuris]